MARRHELRAIRDIARGEDRAGYAPRPGYRAELLITDVPAVRRGKPCTVRGPMFGGCGFVFLDADRDDWAALSHCDDVLELVTTTSLTPIAVEADLIELFLREAAAPLVATAGAMPPRELGAVLRVAFGPLAGRAGPCTACNGVKTTADIQAFGRCVPLTLDWADYKLLG